MSRVGAAFREMFLCKCQGSFCPATTHSPFLPKTRNGTYSLTTWEKQKNKLLDFKDSAEKVKGSFLCV